MPTFCAEVDTPYLTGTLELMVMKISGFQHQKILVIPQGPPPPKASWDLVGPLRAPDQESRGREGHGGEGSYRKKLRDLYRATTPIQWVTGLGAARGLGVQDSWLGGHEAYEV